MLRSIITWALLSHALSLKSQIEGLQNTISSLLDKKLYVRPKDIAAAAISLLKFEPGLQKQLKLVSLIR